jgi:ribonuclease P protein component
LSHGGPRNVSQPLAPSASRLKRRAEFLRVAAKGRKAATHGLVLQALNRGDQGPLRIGFTVTKKVGNAVVRNRSRRRLKEAARLELAAWQINGVDLVLIGREATRGRNFLELRDDFRRALRKAGVGSAGDGMAEVSLPDTRKATAGLADARKAEVGLADTRMAKVRPADARKAEVGLADTRMAEVGLADTRMAKDHTAKARPAKVRTAKVLTAKGQTECQEAS